MAVSKVLLVDDDEDIRTIGSLAFSEVAGWKTYVAPGGEAAVALAAAHHPDVIVLDAVMPEVDGPATVARLKAHPGCANIPVIFLTGRSADDEVAALMDHEVIGVITKPFDPMVLAAQVEALVDEHG